MPTRDEIARVLADELGPGWDYIHTDKADWLATRGICNGTFRDVNDPRRADYLDAADTVLALFAPSPELQRLMEAAVKHEWAFEQYREWARHVDPTNRKSLHELEAAAFAYARTQKDPVG